LDPGQHVFFFEADAARGQPDVRHALLEVTVHRRGLDVQKTGGIGDFEEHGVIPLHVDRNAGRQQDLAVEVEVSAV
jgi:hypothetical protein